MILWPAFHAAAVVLQKTAPSPGVHTAGCPRAPAHYQNHQRRRMFKRSNPFLLPGPFAYSTACCFAAAATAPPRLPLHPLRVPPGGVMRSPPPRRRHCLRRPVQRLRQSSCSSSSLEQEREVLRREARERLGAPPDGALEHQQLLLLQLQQAVLDRARHHEADDRDRAVLAQPAQQQQAETKTQEQGGRETSGSWEAAVRHHLCANASAPLPNAQQTRTPPAGPLVPDQKSVRACGSCPPPGAPPPGSTTGP